MLFARTFPILPDVQYDLTLAEAADALGVPLGTAKSRLAYGLAALRRQLAPDAP